MTNLKNITEKTIESYLVNSVSAKGGVAYKLANIGAKGFPDRTVLYKGAAYFVELKRPKGGVIGGNQKREEKILNYCGFKVWYIHTMEEVDIFCQEVFK